MIYTGGVGLSDLVETVEYAVFALRPHVDEFDSIAVSGMSGVVVGSPVSIELKKPLVIVRKKAEVSHGRDRIINLQHVGDRALFLDDLVESGKTRLHVKTTIERHSVAAVTAQYLYGASGTPQYESLPY